MRDVESERRVCIQTFCWQCKEIKYCRLTYAFDFVSSASVTRSQIADGLGVYRRSRKCLREAVECGGEEVRGHRFLFLTMKGGAKLQAG